MDYNNSVPHFSCIVVGEDSLLFQCCETLLNKEQKIQLVVSDSKRIKNWSASNNINCINYSSFTEDYIRNLSCDYLFSITNLRVIPEKILSVAKKGAINFHDGPLPKYAGLNATSWALLNNERTHGITWHLMTAGVDEGDILKQVSIDILPDETAVSLNTKCFLAASESFETLVDEISLGTVQKVKQNENEKSYFSKFQKPDSAGVISWKKTANQISSLIRSLNFGNYFNPLASAKIRINGDHIIVKDAVEIDGKHQIEPGVITETDDNSITIAAKEGLVKLSSFESLTGKSLSVKEILNNYNLSVGCSFSELSESWKKNLTDFYSRICKSEPYWIKTLQNLEPIQLPFKSSNKLSESKFHSIKIVLDNEVLSGSHIPSQMDSETLIKSAFALYLGKLLDKARFDIGYMPDPVISGTSSFDTLFTNVVPFNIELDSNLRVDEAILKTSDVYKKINKSGTYIYDLIARTPELRNTGIDFNHFPVTIQDGQFGKSTINEHSSLVLFYSIPEKEFYFFYNNSQISAEQCQNIINQFTEFIKNIFTKPEGLLSGLSVLTSNEKNKLLVEWNNTNKTYYKNITIHKLFEEQAKQKPDDIAVICKNEQITFRELNSKSDKLAAYLISKGVGINSFVGISLNRSINMMVAIFAVFKSGAAYVPLDPKFPKERTSMMSEDSDCKVIITESILKNNFGEESAELVLLDTDDVKINSFNGTAPDNNDSTNLAYLIYTSGSTGKPKGVMVTHRNVINFFSGMDDHIEYDDDSSWLAVTSLSFDISVLELLWTLTRGIKVVIYTGEDIKVQTNYAQNSKPSQPIDFSLFYFSSYEGEKDQNKYKLLIEGAKFGDKNDFAAVWTPERHFYDFGGLYSNPSITSAAISTVTEKIKLRAGSVVSPLHNTIRIAEEWSMVDNLSMGRVGIAFASGWQPNDFVIMPQNFEDRKNLMFRQIDEIKKLWRGESVSFMNPIGKMIDINILPKPVQKSLPVWITAASNPETFEMAGRAGYNLLTHLLGQSVSEVGDKIKIYRKAWKEAGHPGEGILTLMLHTFVGTDEKSVKEIVREPMKNYLQSAVNLVKEAAWSFPTFKKVTTNSDGNFSLDNLSSDDLNAILDYSFERYYQSSGLFGTPESCQKIVDELKSIGVDEIACLIDFGIDSEVVLSHLQYLNQLRVLSNQNVNDLNEESFSIEWLIRKHNISHMQCTPSMAKMLTVSDESSEVLKGLKTMLIGGEAFPVNLAKKLFNTVSGSVLNMYGPTETTIWSTLYKLSEPIQDSISIGKPIANTQIYILDSQNNPSSIGVAGELCIGGDGVTNGYFNRQQLTDERFIQNPFSQDTKNKIYRTGDLARYSPDGTIEFLGRSDNQVKIRGYRIELGDIESQITSHPDVRESVVFAREDIPGDQRLVAYIISKNGLVESDALKQFLKDKLPEYMVPAHFVNMQSFPLTPNGKIDRKVFPPPLNEATNELTVDVVLPNGELEIAIADIWKRLLNTNKVGVKDNFFDIGGHSLLAVQMHSEIKKSVNEELTLIDIFRYPTIISLVDYIKKKKNDEEVVKQPVTSKRAELSKQRLKRLK
ncbi:MAG: LLM class flavin-dependent oxidoreductase [Ignavibacteriales bacterium]|nr:MAG: LLM class flavin-dependent oxidoreductase [Ignavibacteriales bacterium]